MEERICIGKIVAAHGIKGEVKVQPKRSNPADWEKLGELENKDANKIFVIKVVGKSLANANVRVKIKGVDTRNEAEALIGTELYANRDKLPQLDDEEYYLQDLIGLKVCLKTPDNVVGKVLQFYNFGAGDIIELKLNAQKATEMLPFTKQYVPEINIAQGYVIVSSTTMIYAADDEGEDDAQG
ncbi:MAG: 16S rRNA processing protein RimM [Alphaproteobacteria bacterium]|nr:16S rRNA processing protein RimM [Alphaproteobacteria bacterium]